MSLAASCSIEDGAPLEDQTRGIRQAATGMCSMARRSPRRAPLRLDARRAVLDRRREEPGEEHQQPDPEDHELLALLPALLQERELAPLDLHVLHVEVAAEDNESHQRQHDREAGVPDADVP